MTENEQIEEIARIIDNAQCIDMTIEACRAETRLGNSCSMCKAKRLYSKDYRKVERGEWKDKRCTKCGETMWYIARGNALATTFYQVKSKFCPECGADMRGEKE